MEAIHYGLQQIRSPNTTSPNSSSISTTGCSNGVAAAGPQAPAPLTPKSVPRSIDANPCATTFVQADAGSFKQVVQMLTGSSETAAKNSAAPPAKNAIPSVGKVTGPKKPAFKLYERRGSLKNLKMISPLIPAFIGSNPSSPVGTVSAFSPRWQPEILSPSMLDLPSLTLSPVTPLIPDPFNRLPPQPDTASAASAARMTAEDRAIAEKGFYLHPSPRTTPRDAEPPRLLSLFPETSPRVSPASSAGPST